MHFISSKPCSFARTAFVPMTKNGLNNLDGSNVNGACMKKSIAVVGIDIGTWGILKCRF